MRVLLDANIILDCLILEKSGLPRSGKAGSETMIDLCDRRVHHGLVAWHTLPIISYFANASLPALTPEDFLLAYPLPL